MYGLYVHIPYCHQKCAYCDFYTLKNQQVPNEYIDALLACFEQYAPRDSKGAVQAPSTVYFGGGTPSLLTPAQIEKMLVFFAPSAGAEITMEANPESVHLNKLVGWHSAGVNRLSLGVQCADDEVLKQLGRLHTTQQAKQTLDLARKAGFENISGDIMLALPNYSNKIFDDTLSLLKNAGVQHISSYLLKIEPKTLFGKHRPQGLPSDDAAADFYLYATEQLEQAGYLQYEVSNYAKQGYESKHNLLYWDVADYLGIGPAAYSALQGERFSFKAAIHPFLKQDFLVRQDEAVTVEDYIMLRLRLNEGLSSKNLFERYATALTAQQEQYLELLTKQGLAVKKNDAWCLTPQGMLVQNSILSTLI